MAVTVTIHPDLAATGYVSVAEFKAWCDQRLKVYTGKTDDQIGAAINAGAEHLDATYQFHGYRKDKAQEREHPRENLWDSRGDKVDGVHKAVKDANCELGFRALNGVDLFPDPVRDGSGRVVKQKDEKVGPISESVTYDDRFAYDRPSFPKVTALLARHGLICSRSGISSGDVVRG